ncbi:hypothetical protein AACH06_25555 [Ideonella sp. DXS29W]|uniref:Uncharacterized protein n=1 Tax=Ideonella lacteola TaxID=2984193 RepID=A0ABU9BW61_9BURK
MKEIRTVGELQRLLAAMPPDLPLVKAFAGQIEALRVVAVRADLTALRAAYADQEAPFLNNLNIESILFTPSLRATPTQRQD